ncbi:MAG: response regulator transcription factor, partial [Limisphaerales bacterium]
MSRILIIEDELPMRTALSDCLQSEGYRVLTADNGECGLKKALEEQPDLILLDVMMPRLDGFEVAAELRRLKQTVPILMLTAKGMVQDRVAGLDAGADDYLVKPFSLDELLARVRAILRRTQKEKKPLGIIRLGDLQISFP